MIKNDYKCSIFKMITTVRKEFYNCKTKQLKYAKVLS
jgi:hypothetical protein